jgi:hypothetical protein
MKAPDWLYELQRRNKSAQLTKADVAGALGVNVNRLDYLMRVKKTFPQPDFRSSGATGCGGHTHRFGQSRAYWYPGTVIQHLEAQPG